ncbi:hypothetical protein [Flagellimonas sp.]|uniref:hypothetical protein n=1 Tax=Flagellimonas sp. TaxID=2058762 RepID=UPI003B51BC63
MRKSRFVLLAIFLVATLKLSAQGKYEQETRIPKAQFPSNALELVSPYLEDAKRVRFYHEQDSTKRSYEVKFKNRKLHYSIEFNEQGLLEDVEFIIQKGDIPEDSWNNMTNKLTSKFKKFRIKKIQQQYPCKDRDSKEVMQQAFQNLILSYINYELVFAAKDKQQFKTYEALFNSEGTLLKLRQSFTSNYDHILY